VVTRNKPYLAKLDTHKPAPFFTMYLVVVFMFVLVAWLQIPCAALW